MLVACCLLFVVCCLLSFVVDHFTFVYLSTRFLFQARSRAVLCNIQGKGVRSARENRKECDSFVTALVSGRPIDQDSFDVISKEGVTSSELQKLFEEGKGGELIRNEGEMYEIAVLLLTAIFVCVMS